MRALVAGATGFTGTILTRRLLGDGVLVRALVRDRNRTRDLPTSEIELHDGDVLDPATLAGAGEGVDVAYYLVHSMGRGGDGDFEERERRAARAFAPSVAGSRAREIQIDGQDVLAYADMLDRMAVALGKRPRPRSPCRC